MRRTESLDSREGKGGGEKKKKKTDDQVNLTENQSDPSLFLYEYSLEIDYTWKQACIWGFFSFRLN